MSAEIICIGTELLLGDILNSNAQYLAQELAKLGIPHYYQSTVGDNIERIHQVLKVATQRASILIFTGGLGPTPDDLTTEAIATFFQTPLIEKPEIIEDIKEKFGKIGKTMSPSNEKQALLPQGATILPNPSGTAPGLIWQPQPHLTLLTFPGVPSEMKRMWEETAIPFLKSQGWGKDLIYSRWLRFRGIGESVLAEKVRPLLDLTNPTVAPYASLGEAKLRISAKAPSVSQAIALIEPVAQQIKALIGIDYYGEDQDTLASVVGILLRKQHQTLSIAESCTGGGLGQMLTSVPGSSDYFLGGVIAYHNRIKQELLGVKSESLEKYGAVSSEVAKEMAIGVKKCCNSDWGIAITGIAGPDGGTPEKPLGLVYIGLADPNDSGVSFEYQFGDRRDRETIRYLSACSALDQLRRQLIDD